MEILFEILVGLFQFLIEFLIPVFGEAALDFGIDRYEHRRAPLLLAMLGHAVVGALLGYASLWLLPNLMIHSESLRLANLLLMPLLCGFVTSILRNSWRGRAPIWPLHKRMFLCAWSFALALSFVRYWFSA